MTLSFPTRRSSDLDDLPAMDDDDLRRGRATTHRAYDEATAILVGDALQAQAFHVLAADHDAGLVPAQRLAMVERSEEHTSELQSLMRISYAVFCSQKTTQTQPKQIEPLTHLT